MGADVTVATRLDGHVVLLYASEHERVARLKAWVERGLERGQLVLLTRAPDEPDARTLVPLEEAGLDVDQARRSGQLALLPPSEFYPANGQDEVVNRAYALGFSGVRLSGPASSALGLMSAVEYLTIEQAMDSRCRDGSVSAMCQYARPATAGSWLRDALTAHVDGVWSEAFSASRGSRRLSLAGEVDLLNADVLGAAVHAALGQMSGASPDADGQELVLDLSGLDFIDVAGCRLLLQETADLRRAGGRLVLVGLRAAVARTLRLMEVAAVPGVHVVGGST